MERVLDLNIFYREDWSKETGSTWSDKFTIEAYIKTYADDGAVYSDETGITIECDDFETQWLAEQFPESEYGSDFWIFADEVIIPSRRIKNILDSIKLVHIENAARLTYSGPITM